MTSKTPFKYPSTDNQLQVYEPEDNPGALSEFIQGQTFFHTEIRSILLFVLLGKGLNFKTLQKL